MARIAPKSLPTILAICLALLACAYLQGCKPRQTAPPTVATAVVQAPLTLGDIVASDLRTVGLPIEALWKDDTLAFMQECVMQFHYPHLDGQAAFNGRMDTMVEFQKADFELLCGSSDEANADEQEVGQGYLWAEEGVMGENWVSLLVEFDSYGAGGKSHPIARSMNYHPPSGTWLELQDVFELEADSTYRLLRRLVLQKIKAENLLENAEATLFDNGAQETEEVFSAFLRTEQGLVFVFGPGQCYQLYWAGNMQVLLEWETPIE